MRGSYASGHSLHVRVTQTLRLINKSYTEPLFWNPVQRYIKKTEPQKNATSLILLLLLCYCSLFLLLKYFLNPASSRGKLGISFFNSL